MRIRLCCLLALCASALSLAAAGGAAQRVSASWAMQQHRVSDSRALYLPVLLKKQRLPVSVIPATTRVVDDETAAQLVDISSDGSVFTFERLTPLLASVSAGEIIVGGPHALAPYGLLRRVSAVERTSSRVVLRTVAATLEEAIQGGTVLVTRRLTAADIEGVASPMATGLARPTDAVTTTALVFEIDSLVLYDQDSDHGTLEDQVVANGRLELMPEIGFRFDLHDSQLSELEVLLELQEDMRLDIRAGVNLEDAELNQEIARLDLGTGVAFVGPVPVVYSIELPVQLRVEGSLSEGVRAQVAQRATVTAGLRYAEGHWSPVSSLTASFRHEPPQARATASVRGYLEAWLDVGLYGSSEAFARVAPYLELAASPGQVPWWQLYGGTQAQVGSKMAVLARSPGEHSETVISDRTLLAQATDEGPSPAPTATPDGRRRGAWVDEVKVVEEPDLTAAIDRLAAGDIDVYAAGVLSPEAAAQIRATAAVDYDLSYVTSDELTFNPAACAVPARLNPFANPRIREAMNYLVDREYLVREILGGLGVPRWVPVRVASADHARMAAEIRAIELEYGYNPDLARRIVSEEMARLGATLEGGRWHYYGLPVILTGLIRVEDERRDIGEYFARQLESIGFSVAREFKPLGEGAHVWQQSDPRDCIWHFYTGGWIHQKYNRDHAGDFSFFYTPDGLPRPLWQAYRPTEAFADVARRLRERDFRTLSQRRALFAQALRLAMQDSVRIWLLDRSSISPRRSEIQLASPFAGCCFETRVWPNTLRRGSEEGGRVTWAVPQVLVAPWNPIEVGPTDLRLVLATSQAAVVEDPTTGLNLPYRIATAHITVKDGLPVARTLHWPVVHRAPEIVVPEDAWVDWNSASQSFVTAAQTGQQRTALIKTVVTYPSDLFRTVKWHDGSHLSIGDMLLPLIVMFDRSKEESPIYDDSAAIAMASFEKTFKGIRLRSIDPLTIEYYSDNWLLDVENTIGNINSLWPTYGSGDAPWHTVALGLLAEASGKGAFSVSKANMLGVERLNYLWGPTVPLLANQLAAASASGHVPYERVMRNFVTDSEVAQRYMNLEAWYRRTGHFWLGTGPFMLAAVSAERKELVLERFVSFPDPAGRWTWLVAPRVPTVAVLGPDTIQIGQPAQFSVLVTAQGEPLGRTEIQEVRWLLIGPDEKVVRLGSARSDRGGEWCVDLPGSVTERLAAGQGRLEAIAATKTHLVTPGGQKEFLVVP